MGMDVCGKKPTGDDGSYFRNSGWWWRRLWEFACDCAGIDDDLRHRGHHNDGAGLDAEGANAMAQALRGALEDGSVDRYERELAKAVEEAQGEACEICGGGDMLKKSHGETGCSRCGGAGMVKPYWTEYPFDRKNVEHFARFLAESGGFEIW